MKKVLIVDDDASIIEVLRLYFEKEGYAVSVCMQGDKALSTFHASNPDIVILDLMLLVWMATMYVVRFERIAIRQLLC